MAIDRKKLTDIFIFFGFGISGSAALIYEVLWTRSLSTILGSSTYALSTMLAAFMGGLSIGGLIGGKLTGKFEKM
jgi:spermidine synthase